jgi:hypothetical protein
VGGLYKVSVEINSKALGDSERLFGGARLLLVIICEDTTKTIIFNL